MARKKWTPKIENTEALFDYREKRKWQIALRRYIFLENPCVNYAPFFGIDALKLREWIKIQFEEGMSWDNFNRKWYLGHVLSPGFFDLSKLEDLKLCWNFINICIISKDSAFTENNDLILAKQYYQNINDIANQQICSGILKKIEEAEKAAGKSFVSRIQFAKTNQEYLAKISEFESYEFTKLNNGVDVDQIIREKELMNRF